MLHGGSGWHSNILAELFVAVAYLHPDFERPELPSTDCRFPPPAEDPFYELLLERRRLCAGRPDSAQRRLYKDMSVFLAPNKRRLCRRLIDTVAGVWRGTRE